MLSDVYVMICLLVCTHDSFCVSLGSIFPSYRPSETVFKITFWLGYFNSCINPIIYPCFSQEFKKAFLSVLGIPCLHRSPRPRYPLCQSHAASHGQSQLLSLGLESRMETSRLSQCSSLALSRTPSSSPVGVTGVSSGVCAGARVCGKNLLRTCCCEGLYPERTQTPAKRSLPVIKIHRLSLCENGDAV